MHTVSVSLQEWTERTVDAELDASSRSLAATLAKLDRLHVEERRATVRIEATSYVGHVQIGPLRISVQPKLRGAPLQRLLRYAYGLRNLELFDTVEQGIAEDSLLELLVHQLAVEVDELLARGLHRAYARRQESLPSPRGRLDLQRYVRQGGIALAALPSVYHDRISDCSLNQVILAGLREAAELVIDRQLRIRVLRLVARMDGEVSRTMLRPQHLERVIANLDRHTEAYGSALRLIKLLSENRGLDTAEGTSRLVGFLFDMNAFFQHLLGRFLEEHLSLVIPGAILEQEHRLTGMLAYATDQNPRHRQAPTPRPDFAVFGSGRLLALLDAKYRDLWEKPLPREMLYQLSMYALSQGDGGRATILYPTMHPEAKEARIEIRDPHSGSMKADVVLRPVSLPTFDEALQGAGTEAETRRAALAKRLLLGHGTGTH